MLYIKQQNRSSFSFTNKLFCKLKTEIRKNKSTFSSAQKMQNTKRALDPNGKYLTQSRYICSCAN